MQKIELIHGACADQKADVIVNAANKYLMQGGGICGVIFGKTLCPLFVVFLLSCVNVKYLALDS